jgi:hypothetical protein
MGPGRGVAGTPPEGEPFRGRALKGFRDPSAWTYPSRVNQEMGS